MLIQPYGSYEILCKNTATGVLYRWHLDVIPGNKAWKVVNMYLSPGTLIKGFSILSINDLTDYSSPVISKRCYDFR